MKKRMSANLAGNILLLALGLLAIFHVLVLLNVLPANIVWGGQRQVAPTNLFVLESVALMVTLLFASIVAARINYIRARRFRLAVRIGIWIIFAYLVLNTVGNLASQVAFENWVFAPVTLVLAFCALRLALEKETG